MGKVLGVVYRTLATYQVRKAGYTRRTGKGAGGFSDSPVETGA